MERARKGGQLVSFLAGLLLASSAFAGGTIGEWTWDDTSFLNKKNDNMYAVVVNDADQMFGQFCYPENDKCLWILAIQTGCEQDISIPAIFNSEQGVATVAMYCAGERKINNKTYYRYAAKDFDTVDELVRKNNSTNSLGIVIPIEGDKFRVSRFSLSGSTKAIDAMRKKATAAGEAANRGGANKTAPRKQPADQVL